MKKLRLSIQTLTRSTNPLGKLLSFLQEDVDIMQKELNSWKEMNANLDQEIDQERRWEILLKIFAALNFLKLKFLV